jgi:hypothetical protein
MPAFTKRKSKIRVHLSHSDQASAHGGQVLIDALCRRFDLWKRILDEPSLDPRSRRGSGFAPASVVAQLIFSLTSGGAGLADAERLGRDKVLRGLVGLEAGADQSTLGEWLRAQSRESVLAIHRINAQLVDWAIQNAAPQRWLHAGQAEVFFDDTEIEVQGKNFEGARFNYEGNRALSWQTLWLGPWLLDGILDGAGDVSQHLAALLSEHRSRWENRPSHFYADSGSSAGKHLNVIETSGFSTWSVSYNKWTSVLDRLAAELPENQWSPAIDTDLLHEQYAWLKHQPGECQTAQTFAVTRWKNDGDLMWRHAYVVCKSEAQTTPQAAIERHQLKGAREQALSEVLSGLDLHHPPCSSLLANQAFYAIATLAYNILITLKVLDLPDEAQTWRVQTLIRHLLTLPVSLSTHARHTVAQICVPSGWLRWWRFFADQWLPKRKAGRPIQEEVDTA